MHWWPAAGYSRGCGSLRTWLRALQTLQFEGVPFYDRLLDFRIFGKYAVTEFRSRAVAPGSGQPKVAPSFLKSSAQL